MCPSIAATIVPATDLRYVLMKHPGRVHEVELAFGKAVVVYPQATEARCEASVAPNRTLRLAMNGESRERPGIVAIPIPLEVRVTPLPGGARVRSFFDDSVENLECLKQRGVAGKRALALVAFALGIEARERFVARQPLWRVHECVFAVLGRGSAPIDPRLSLHPSSQGEASEVESPDQGATEHARGVRVLTNAVRNYAGEGAISQPAE